MFFDSFALVLPDKCRRCPSDVAVRNTRRECRLAGSTSATTAGTLARLAMFAVSISAAAVAWNCGSTAFLRAQPAAGQSPCVRSGVLSPAGALVFAPPSYSDTRPTSVNTRLRPQRVRRHIGQRMSDIELFKYIERLKQNKQRDKSRAKKGKRAPKMERMKMRYGVGYDQRARLMERVRTPNIRKEALVQAVQELQANDLLYEGRDYTSIVSAFGRQSMVDNAVEVLQSMRKAKQDMNVITYSAAIGACEKRGRWDIALALMQELQAEKVAPNAVTYNTVISACEKGGKWQQALEQFEDLLVDEEAEPTEISYGAAFSACRRGRQWQHALDLKELMKRSSLGSTISWSTLIHTCEKSQQPQLALQLFGEMKTSNFHPDRKTYKVLMRACQKAGFWKRAEHFIETMKEEGLEPDISMYSGLIQAYGRSGEVTRAMMLFRQIRTDEKMADDPEVFSAAVAACQLGGRSDRALKIFDEMEETGIAPTNAGLKSALRACEEMRLSTRRQAMFDKARKKGVRLDADIYNSAISASAREQQQQLALELFDEMESIGFAPNSDAYRLALDRAVRKHEWRELDALYPAAIAQCLEAAKTRTAPQDDDEELPDTEQTATNTGVQDDNPGVKADQLIGEMQEYDVRPDGYSYSLAIEACALSGEGALAAQLLAEARAARAPLPQSAFTAVMQAHSAEQSWESALALLADMRATALEPSAEALTAALNCVADSGHAIGQGIGLAVSGGEKTEYAPIMAACIKAQDYHRALAIFDEADESSVDGCQDEDMFRVAIRAAELSDGNEKERLRDLRGRLRYLLTGDKGMLQRMANKPRDNSVAARFRRGEFKKQKNKGSRPRNKDTTYDSQEYPSYSERGGPDGNLERILF
eukprot:TRINITY_DN45042_c0_g1_i1.p1 TRINITY_DN45042_c0_g1~~TRINITY_DN45042_c0_g1_i1.p1  ORF type:complete len:876 (+),score=194.50 TRINITY_DN45042_c0_g1_i1:76-2703(+)